MTTVDSKQFVEFHCRWKEINLECGLQFTGQLTADLHVIKQDKRCQIK